MPAPSRAISIEDLWREAARATIAHGAAVDPPIDRLKRLTTPEVAWTDIIPWPIDHAHDRLARMFDTHHLAIACRDRDWLLQLHDAWDAAPWDYRPQPLRAQGESRSRWRRTARARRAGRPRRSRSSSRRGICRRTFPASTPGRCWRRVTAGCARALAAHDEGSRLTSAKLDQGRRRRGTAARRCARPLRRVESRALHALLDVQRPGYCAVCCSCCWSSARGRSRGWTSMWRFASMAHDVSGYLLTRPAAAPRASWKRPRPASAFTTIQARSVGVGAFAGARCSPVAPAR